MVSITSYTHNMPCRPVPRELPKLSLAACGHAALESPHRLQGSCFTIRPLESQEESCRQSCTLAVSHLDIQRINYTCSNYGGIELDQHQGLRSVERPDYRCLGGLQPTRARYRGFRCAAAAVIEFRIKNNGKGRATGLGELPLPNRECLT